MISLDSFNDCKIAVVGGAGFVGSNLSHKLLQQSDLQQLIIVDNLLSSDICNVSDDERVLFIKGSIADDEILAQLPEDLDYVFHLACYHGNQSSIADPLADHQNNTLTTLKLFESLYKNKSLKKVVYAAAGCAVAEKTFDTAEATIEDAPVSLFHDSPYSISKLVGEMYGNFYFRQYGLPFVKARFQNVYGPREMLGAGEWRGTPHTVWRNVTPTFIWKALHKEELPLEKGGIATRDFIYVEDLAEGLIRCAVFGESGGIYNLATGVETSIAELARLINVITNNSAGTINAEARAWDNSGKRFGSTEKARAALGFEANTKLENGLRATIKWTQDNQTLISSTIQRFAKHLPHVTQYKTGA